MSTEYGLLSLSISKSKLFSMKSFVYLFFSAALLMLSSCSKNLTYYTDDIQNDFRWSESELKQIQFYVSEDIRLVRASNNGMSEIENGQIKIKDNREVDEVIIKKGTPGTLVFSPNDNRFAVCFDEDSSKYLMFGPNKKANGRYLLLANNWKKQRGVITYGDEKYTTSSASAYAALMVDISKAKKVSKQSETASGRRVRG